ncbi:hypothetical protein GMJAKD_03810 [Candidatus Electrothrix aarhusensis]
MTKEDAYKKLFEECRMLILSQDFSLSLPKLDQLITQFPDQPDPLLLKANALVMLRGNEGHSENDNEQFIREQKECIQKALDMYPEHVLALIDMADFCADTMNLKINRKSIGSDSIDFVKIIN